MYRNSLVILLVLVGNFAFSQLLKGRVLDNSGQPLPGTTVYYDGTTISTLTNEKGEFALSYNIKLSRPLVFSYMGYQTVFINNYTSDMDMEIVLTPAINALKEVIVRKDNFPRSEALRIFRERFLGTTIFASQSSIQNEQDIEFVYDEKALLLKASSDVPLIILNPSLGYKIAYELVAFEAKLSPIRIEKPIVLQSFYAGLSRYEQTDSNPEIIENREKAYQGSSAHFFRCLINKMWNKDNFALFENHHVVIPSDYFSISVEEDKYKVEIKKQEKIANTYQPAVAVFDVLYKGKWKSVVKFDTATIYLDAFGNNLNPREVSFSGYIGLKRTGDTLPFDYGIN